MLPTPAVRARRQRSFGDWLRAVDDYTRWAFNPPRGRTRR